MVIYSYWCEVMSGAASDCSDKASPDCVSEHSSLRRKFGGDSYSVLHTAKFCGDSYSGVMIGWHEAIFITQRSSVVIAAVG